MDQDQFDSNQLCSLQAQVDNLFDGSYKFCKPMDKKVSDHMNDFIYGAKAYSEISNSIDDEVLRWEAITKRIHDTPMNSLGFITPAEFFINYCCKLKH